MTTKMKLSDSVNKLIADEWIAEFTYDMQSVVCEGAGFDAVSKRLAEMSKDEKEHRQKLVTWMQSKGFSIITNPIVLMRECNPSGRFNDFTDPIDTLDCVKRGIKSEINAKNMYLLYYKAVKEQYPDLAHLYMEIANEENEHRVELEDLLHMIEHTEQK